MPVNGLTDIKAEPAHPRDKNSLPTPQSERAPDARTH